MNFWPLLDFFSRLVVTWCRWQSAIWDKNWISYISFAFSFLLWCFNVSSPQFWIPYGLLHFFRFLIRSMLMWWRKIPKREIPSRKHQSTHNLNVNFFMTMTANPFIEFICRWQKSNCCEQRLCHIGDENFPFSYVDGGINWISLCFSEIECALHFFMLSQTKCVHVQLFVRWPLFTVPDKITLYEWQNKWWNIFDKNILPASA